ncbi:MAG: Hsp20/alpha crystallin family protein, partial [Candidatus Nitrosocaldus sp.]
EEREPLVDVMSTDGELKVIAELPGINKEDIRVTATEKSVNIRAENPERKYSKSIDLPEEVDPASAKSTYKNGILEITFKKKGSKQEGFTIKVE